ncbi:MAG: diphthine synthase [Nanoarchaeota archaeon]
MLYIIGLGLNIDGISKYGLDTVMRCKRVYLENYTVEFPYSAGELQQLIDKKLILVDREKVESLELVDEAKKMDIALLVYGSPLTATTHISLIQEAKRTRVKYKIIYSSSILDAIGETGLQLYKFGKIASMPAWNPEQNFTPESFIEIVKENQSIDAHTLILVDIGLKFKDGLNQLKEVISKNKMKLGSIIACSRLGTKDAKVFYDKIESLKNLEIETPYCFIIPSKLHFIEEEVLEGFKKFHIK